MTVSRVPWDIKLLHDFDKNGFSIAETLQTSTRRYTHETEGEYEVIDLGAMGGHRGALCRESGAQQ
jgi:hypothetical protein